MVTADKSVREQDSGWWWRKWVVAILPRPSHVCLHSGNTGWRDLRSGEDNNYPDQHRITAFKWRCHPRAKCNLRSQTLSVRFQPTPLGGDPCAHTVYDYCRLCKQAARDLFGPPSLIVRGIRYVATYVVFPVDAVEIQKCSGDRSCLYIQ